MKKVITICLLVVTLLAGGMSMDAKTTKKTSKAKTTRTSSSSKYWDGDMPTATLALAFVGPANKNSDSYGFAQKGYRVTEGEVCDAWIKDGVCKIENWGGSGGGETTVTVYDTSKLNQLYNAIKTAAQKRGLEVNKNGNSIFIFFE